MQVIENNLLLVKRVFFLNKSMIKKHIKMFDDEVEKYVLRVSD